MFRYIVLIVAVVEAWYSITNLLKRYCLTFINRIDNDKVVKTGEMGGGRKRVDLPKSGKV